MPSDRGLDAEDCLEYGSESGLEADCCPEDGMEEEWVSPRDEPDTSSPDEPRTPPSDPELGTSTDQFMMFH